MEKLVLLCVCLLWSARIGLFALGMHLPGRALFPSTPDPVKDVAKVDDLPEDVHSDTL